jgi:hypothetical protein
LVRVSLIASFRPSSEPIVGRMCYIDPSLADFPLINTFDGFEVEIRFPKLTFPLPAAGYYNAAPPGEPNYKPTQLMPAHFIARVIFTTVDDIKSPDYLSTFQSAMDAMFTAAARLSDSIRLIQPSVGLPGETPETLSCVAIDPETEVEIAIPVPIKKGIGLVVGYPPLTLERAQQVLRDGPDAISSLLAQAKYLVRSVRDPQPGLAILLAAVACEARVKEVLLERASPATKPLLDTLLRKPRIFQEPALELFGEVSKAVLGKSLREDDRPLWKKIDELFQARNKMAHVADRPPLEKARELVFAANDAMEWLDSNPKTSTEIQPVAIDLRYRRCSSSTNSPTDCRS